jgi:hypothetical protein
MPVGESVDPVVSPVSPPIGTLGLLLVSLLVEQPTLRVSAAARPSDASTLLLVEVTLADRAVVADRDVVGAMESSSVVGYAPPVPQMTVWYASVAQLLPANY